MIRYQYKNSELLFVGINPHHGSFDRGIPFSNNKLFWYLLARAGLISETIDDLRDDIKLREIYKNKFNKIYKLGLINIIDRPTRDITLLKKGEEEQKKAKIERIIKTHKPKIVCFIGKVSYEKYIGSKDFTFGWQDDIYQSRAFVMHFPLRGKAEVRIDELKEVARASGVGGLTI
ncbi:MAG: uracil-DNA glycosylase family protein [Pyrinomonadaceae bacterium]